MLPLPSGQKLQPLALFPIQGGGLPNPTNNMSPSTQLPAPTMTTGGQILLDPATYAYLQQMAVLGQMTVASQNSTTLTLPEGTYEGEVQSGKPHGNGVLTYNSGDTHGRKIYKGQFNNGVRHGNGVLTWNDRREFNGGWANNKMEGKGLYITSDGYKWEGSWEKDKMEGHFKWSHPNGDYWTGQCINNLREGQWTCTTAKGVTMSFQYLHDNIRPVKLCEIL